MFFGKRERPSIFARWAHDMMAHTSRLRSTLIYTLCACVVIAVMTFLKEENYFDGQTRLTLPLDRNACTTSTREGDHEDGGWWICSPIPKDCVVYSFGIKDNFSFDKAMVKRGCAVHGFDPSPDGLASKRAYEAFGAVYHDFGVGGVDRTYEPGTVPFHWPGIGYLRASNTQPWTLRRIPTILTTLGQGPSILKLDVEGTEWSMLKDIVASNTWEQIMVEFHFPPKEYTVSQGSDGELRIFRNVEKGPDRVGMLQELFNVATMWKWDFNSNGRQCLEAYFVRSMKTPPSRKAEVHHVSFVRIFFARILTAILPESWRL